MYVYTSVAVHYTSLQALSLEAVAPLHLQHTHTQWTQQAIQRVVTYIELRF